MSLIYGHFGDLDPDVAQNKFPSTILHAASTRHTKFLKYSSDCFSSITTFRNRKLSRFIIKKVSFHSNQGHVWPSQTPCTTKHTLPNSCAYISLQTLLDFVVEQIIATAIPKPSSTK